MTDTNEYQKSDYISRLNTQIATINDESIKAHIEQGDLEKWICDWRIETAAISFGLYTHICGLCENSTGFIESEEMYDA